jgi:hypothetical protein
MAIHTTEAVKIIKGQGKDAHGDLIQALNDEFEDSIDIEWIVNTFAATSAMLIGEEPLCIVLLNDCGRVLKCNIYPTR